MNHLGRTETEIGILSSIVFFPSLVTSIAMAPLVTRFGSLTCGIAFNIANLILTIPMLIFSDNFYVLLVLRFFFGIFNEPNWLVQSAIVTDYIPLQIQSLGHGLTMSIATSANLIGFAAVPLIWAIEMPEY